MTTFLYRATVIVLLLCITSLVMLSDCASPADVKFEIQWHEVTKENSPLFN